jgi:hypothetical protein
MWVYGWGAIKPRSPAVFPGLLRARAANRRGNLEVQKKSPFYCVVVFSQSVPVLHPFGRSRVQAWRVGSGGTRWYTCQIRGYIILLRTRFAGTSKDCESAFSTLFPAVVFFGFFFFPIPVFWQRDRVLAFPARVEKKVCFCPSSACQKRWEQS